MSVSKVKSKTDAKLITREILIPDGITAKLEGKKLVVKGQKGELSRVFSHTSVRMEVKDGKIKIVGDNDRKKVKAVVGTWEAHIRNMFIGVTKGWTASLKAVYSHFPVKLSVEKNIVLISNFLGERKPRIAKIFGNTKVDIRGTEIIVSGIDKEEVGQTAAAIEQATHVTGRDRRIFCDGVWITEKCRPQE